MSRRSAHARTASYLRPERAPFRERKNSNGGDHGEVPSNPPRAEEVPFPADPGQCTGTFRRAPQITEVMHGAPRMPPSGTLEATTASPPPLNRSFPENADDAAMGALRHELARLRQENGRLLAELDALRSEATPETATEHPAGEDQGSHPQRLGAECFAELRRTVDALQDRRAFELAALEGARAEAQMLRDVALKAEAAQEGAALAAEHLRRELDSVLAAAAQATDERDAGWHLLKVARRELARAQEHQGRLKEMYEAEISGLRAQRDGAQRVINSQLPPALAEEIPAPTFDDLPTP